MLSNRILVKRVVNEKSTDFLFRELPDKLLPSLSRRSQACRSFSLSRDILSITRHVVFHIELSFLFCNQNKEQTLALISLLRRSRPRPMRREPIGVDKLKISLSCFASPLKMKSQLECSTVENSWFTCAWQECCGSRVSLSHLISFGTNRSILGESVRMSCACERWK